jgi:hypothetical protein
MTLPPLLPLGELDRRRVSDPSHGDLCEEGGSASRGSRVGSGVEAAAGVRKPVQPAAV